MEIQRGSLTSSPLSETPNKGTAVIGIRLDCRAVLKGKSHNCCKGKALAKSLLK